MATDDKKKKERILTDDVIPQDDEYYTLDLDRRKQKDEELNESGFDLTADMPDGDIEMVDSASLYEGNVVQMDAEENEAPITDQNTTSAYVGAPGHPGIDEDTG